MQRVSVGVWERETVWIWVCGDECVSAYRPSPVSKLRFYFFSFLLSQTCFSFTDNLNIGPLQTLMWTQEGVDITLQMTQRSDFNDLFGDRVSFCFQSPVIQQPFFFCLFLFAYFSCSAFFSATHPRYHFLVHFRMYIHRHEQRFRVIIMNKN